MSTTTDLLALRAHLVERIRAIDVALEREQARICADPDPMAGLEVFLGQPGADMVTRPAPVTREPFPTPEHERRHAEHLEKQIDEDVPESPAKKLRGAWEPEAIAYYDAHPQATDSEIARAVGMSQPVVSKFLRKAGRPPRGSMPKRKTKTVPTQPETPQKNLPTPYENPPPSGGIVAIKPVVAFDPEQRITTMREAQQVLGGRITKWTRGDGSVEWLLDGKQASEAQIFTAAQKGSRA